jgi:integrase
MIEKPRQRRGPSKSPNTRSYPAHPGEARRLLNTVQGDRLEALYVVALHTGLRQGDLLALRWEDLDLEARKLQVRRTVTKDGGKLSISPAKTAKGREGR